MTSTVDHLAPAPESAAPEPPAEPKPPAPSFVLYLSGPEYVEALDRLGKWVEHLLLPVYGREVTSSAPWCSRWWAHPEAIAQLYGLWMAWQELTGPGSALTGPAMWHRDYLILTMNSLRDPSGPFAGCKPGSHRAKETPPVERLTA